jgi:hypothetical protein
MQWRRSDGHEISDEPGRLDVGSVARWLHDDAYWSKGRSRETVERSIEHSLNLGLYRPDGEHVGFCRWITDRGTFAGSCSRSSTRTAGTHGSASRRCGSPGGGWSG